MRIFRLVPVLAVVAAVAVADKAAQRSPFNLHHRALFFAVFEGLYEDGVSSADLDRILLPEKGTTKPMHFIYGCPVCMPVMDALVAYRNRPDLPYKGVTDNTFGRGLDPKMSAALASDDFKTRATAIHSLIERWVERRLELTRATKQEREAWAKAISAMKKTGEEFLAEQINSGQAGPRTASKECAVCNGADAAMR